MARSRELRVTISGDPRSFSHALKTVDSAAARSEGHLHRLGKAGVTALAGLGAVAGGALVVGLKKSVEAFAEAEQVGAQTNAVLKSTHHQAGLTSKAIAELATQISRKSGMDDEAIQRGENLLLTFRNIRNEAGKGNDIFTRTTRIMADMSVALGQDTKSSAIQLGKALNDPIKGITALQRVGVSFNQQQRDQIKALEDSGHHLEAQKLILRELNKEFGGSAKAAGDTFQGSLNKAKVEVGNLGEEIGSVLAPSLERGTKRFTAFVEEMQSNQGLGGRFMKGLKEGVHGAEGEVKGLVGRFHELRSEGDTVGEALTTMLSDGVSKAIEKSAETAADRAPRVAGAFLHGFTHANIWGKLALGGFLIAKFGGLGAFSAFGRRAGVATASGMAQGATGAPAVGRLGRAIGALKIGGGIAAGAFIGSQLVSGIIHQLSGHNKHNFGNTLADFIESGAPRVPFTPNALDPLGTGVSEAKASTRTYLDYDRAVRRGIISTQQLKDEMNQPGGAGWSKEQGAALRRLGSAIDRQRDSFSRMRKGSVLDIKELRESVLSNFETIAATMGAKSGKGAKDVATNTSLAVKNIKRFMRDGTLTTKQGMAEIERVFRAEMRLYGISGNQANADARGRAYSLGTGNDSSAVNTRHGNAVGGWIGARGQAGQDNIPIIVGAGEAVLNRHQQVPVEMALRSVYGMGLDDLFEKVNKPHYMAQGGLAGVVSGVGSAIQGVGGVTGHSELHPGISRAAAAVLHRFPGLSITSTTGGGHAPGSYHYKGEAVDLASGDYGYMTRAAAWIRSAMGGSLTEGIHNPNLSIKYGKNVSPGFWGAATWAGHANHIHLAVAGALGRIKAGVGSVADLRLIERVRVSGPNSPLKRIIQGSLDTTRRAANMGLKNVAGFASGGIAGLNRIYPAHSLGQRGAQFSPDQVYDVARAAGFGPVAAKHMVEIAHGESSYMPGVVSWDHGIGLWQITPTATAWGANYRSSDLYRHMQSLGGEAGMRNPIQNARMAAYMFSRARYQPWHGTRFLTGMGGKLSGRVRGGDGASIGRMGGKGEGPDLPRFYAPGRGPGPGRTGSTGLGISGNAASGPGIFGKDPTPLDWLNSAAAQAALTPGTDDDIAAAKALERYGEQQYFQARQSGDPRKIAEAANNLKQWQDALQQLKDAIKQAADDTAASNEEFTQALKDNTAAINTQNAQRAAVQNAGEKAVLNMLTGLISGRIGANVNQRQAARTYGSVARA